VDVVVVVRPGRVVRGEAPMGGAGVKMVLITLVVLAMDISVKSARSVRGVCSPNTVRSLLAISSERATRGERGVLLALPRLVERCRCVR